MLPDWVFVGNIVKMFDMSGWAIAEIVSICDPMIKVKIHSGTYEINWYYIHNYLRTLG